MYSTLQRLNNLSSFTLSCTLTLLAIISLISIYTQPSIQNGKLEIKDLIIQKGRLRRWGAKEEELASLRFDIQTNLNPLLNSYNTKQLFLYLTATYSDSSSASSSSFLPSSSSSYPSITQGTKPPGTHEIVLWDRIITRSESRDIRAVGRKLPFHKGSKKGRGNVRIDGGKNSYPWKELSGSFKNVETANMTLYYSLMPYVGMLSTGVAATASGPITLPELIKR